MDRRHLRVVRSIGYVLTLGSRDAWFGLVPVLMARLDTHERAALDFTALKALDRETALMTADAALSTGAGQPLAPLLTYMDEAAFWADMADPVELDAYALATFNRMAPSRQSAFREFIIERAAA
jgi:hypothetical protein